MPLSAHFKDGMHHLYGLIESLVFIEGKECGQLFAREGMFFAYTVAHDHDELPVLGDGKTGYVCQLLGRNGYRIWGAMPFGVPHYGAQLRLFFLVCQIAALFDELGHHGIEDALLYY